MLRSSIVIMCQKLYDTSNEIEEVEQLKQQKWNKNDECCYNKKKGRKI